MNTWRGPWVDHSSSAMDAALAEVNVDRSEYIVLEYGSGGFKLEPVGGDRPAIGVEIIYSEVRDQYRAVIWKQPPAPLE